MAEARPDPGVRLAAPFKHPWVVLTCLDGGLCLDEGFGALAHGARVGSAMDGIRVFFEMDGYGIYVWPAFGVTAIVLIGLALASLRTLRDNEETLAGLQGERRRRSPVAGGQADGTDGDGR